MRKNIYTLFATVMVLFAASASFAQVNVTYQVDITNYLAGGATLNANGIRVGGNFTTVGATAIPDWTPSAAGSAMTDMGNNIWSITVNYPASSIGQTQLYKFVNGDWGTNEGTDAGNTIGADGCGTDDGAGNVNRTLVVPNSDLVLQFCWDHCFKCDGSSPVISGVSNVASVKNTLSVYPSPAVNFTQVNYAVTSKSDVTVNVRSFTGQVIETLVNKVQTPGQYTLDLNTNNYSNGIYFVELSAGGNVMNQRFVVNR